jgi:plasmid stabilization system protein ParE
LTPRANRDRAEAAAWIAEMVGEDVAREWLAGLDAAFGTLAEGPRRYPINAADSHK